MPENDTLDEQISNQTPETEATPVEEQPLDATAELIGRTEKERDDYRDQLVRTLAEFQNYRKRVQSEQAQIRQFATESLVTDLLPVLDNFERSLSALESGANTEKVIEGIVMVDRQLRSILEAQSLTRLYPHLEPFDPEQHDAIAIEAGSEHPEDTIVTVIEPGYKLGDKVIRPARVKVAKN